MTACPPAGGPAPDLRAAIAALAQQRAELGLHVAPPPASLDLAALAHDDETLGRWLTMTASIASGIDGRTAAAYLLSIFVWRFGEILATLHMRGSSLPHLGAGDVLVAMSVGGQGAGRDIRFGVHLDVPPDGVPGDIATLRRSVVDIHRPLVAALHRLTGLPETALWRLVGDGMSGGFLEYGKQHGSVVPAMAAARQLLSASPLHNRQWSFVEIAPAGLASEWFRLRGGCCRLYMTDDGTYCSTCVLEPRATQVARLESLLRRRAGLAG